MKQKKIAVLVGSLRKASFSRKLANTILSDSPESLSMEILEIGNLPLYNQDLDEVPPEAWIEFRKHLKSNAGVLFISPEYNRSIPSALKNAIDIASRPYGSNVFDAKPAGIISTSIGVLGGFGANHHLRQSLVFLNAPCMQQPEAYIGEMAKKFNADGNLNDESTRKFLQTFMSSFATWVNRNAILY